MSIRASPIGPTRGTRTPSPEAPGSTRAPPWARLEGSAASPRLDKPRSNRLRSLEDAVERGLALSPDDRFASVEAFAAETAQFGTKASAASLEHIQRVAEQASAPLSQAPGPLATVDTAAGRDLTSLAGSVAGTPPPLVTTAPPRKARPTRLASLVGVALAAGLGLVGVRSYRLSRGAPASSTAEPAACADGATAECEAACTAKAPGACHALARALENGKGAPADPARAATLYEAECDGGGLRGCNNLGNLYDLGKGVGQDRKKALDLFQQACKGDFGAGCVNVGNAFAEGVVVVKDEGRAARFYARACEDGEPFGCVNLSVFYTDGRGVKQDVARAYSYADMACAKGAQNGCVRVAKAKVLGAGTVKDVPGGLGQLDAMCTQGVVEGCTGLGTVYEHGLGDVPADPIESAKYLKKACELHDTVSCARRSFDRTVDDTSTNPGRFYAALWERCRAGNAESCEQYGRDALSGNGMPKDPVVGAESLKKACALGRVSACEGRAAAPAAAGKP